MRILLALGLAAALTLSSCVSRKDRDAKTAARPNLLFIFADDHASHAISAYGSALNRTPNIDRLAREGMLFRNCFVGNSICAPSRATILTGLHSHRNGVIDNGVVFDGSQPTFPKLLQQAGYQTAMIGKWHLKSDPTGFDHWEILLGQGPYYNPPMKTPAGVVEHEGYTTDVITDRALEWLEHGRDPERPFLLMYQHKAPHREWQPGPGYFDLYDGVTLPEPPTLFDDWSGRAPAAANQEMTVAEHLSDFDLKLTPPRNLTPAQLATWKAAYDPKNAAFRSAGLEGRELVRWKYQRYVKDYLRTIASVDDNLGRVLAWLDRSGLARNTVVVYSSDQGFYLGDHGWFDKRWMYEESFRTPLIVRWPGVTTPGSEDRHLVQNLDFGPTFLDAAGVAVPEEMQGVSLVPLLRGEDPSGWRTSLYYHYYEYPAVHMVEAHYGVRTDRYKLIRYYLSDHWELFDLERDPHELRSVHADPQYAAVRAGLEQELRRLQEFYGDTDPDRSMEAIRAEQARRRAEQVEVELVARWARPPEEEPAAPDPSGRPLTVGGWCRTGSDGVLLAQGGSSFGFSLYLEEGRPAFAVREGGQVHAAVAHQELLPDQRVHLAGVLDARGGLRLLVNGRIAARTQGALLSQKPAEGLAVGSDPKSAVGVYEAPNPFPGELEDLRLYWGALEEEAVQAWMEGR